MSDHPQRSQGDDSTLQMSREEVRIWLASAPVVHGIRIDSTKSELKDSSHTERNKITVEDCHDGDERKTIVTVHRLLDMLECQQFSEQIKSEAVQERRNWAINLTELVFCDSMLLSYCFMWNIICKQFGGKMVFFMRENSYIHEKFRHSRLSEICNIELV
jgi:hypothetical protein